MIKKISILLAVSALLAVPATGQVVTEINFNNIPDVDCNEGWVQNGVNVMVGTTTSEDCDGGGNCTWIPWDGSSGIGMAPARLSVDFSQTYVVFQVEIDIQDYCGIGCTRAFLYNDGVQVASTSNATRGVEETLTLVPTGNLVDSIAVSSCEGVVLGNTIRIIAETVSTEPNSWGTIKGTYR